MAILSAKFHLPILFLVCSSVHFVMAIPVAARVFHVAQNHPLASDTGDGSITNPFKKISRAAELGQPGDTVMVHKGIYRERVAPTRGGEPNRPIIYQAAPGESVIVRGSEIFAPAWRKVDEKRPVYAGALKVLNLPQINPYRLGIDSEASTGTVRPTMNQHVNLPRTAGQMFCDGLPLLQADTLQTVTERSGTWLASADGKEILIHPPPGIDAPQGHLIELSVRDRIFAPVRRGLTDIHVRGFVFEHCANPFPFPQHGAVSTRSGRRWIFENNTIRRANTIGLDIGSESWDGTKIPDTVAEDRHVIIGGDHLAVGNHISDNGLCGIVGWNTDRCRIIGNVIERNNFLGFNREEEAGIKMHIFRDGLIERNLVRGNDAYGIWIDNGQRNARVTGNLVIDNTRAGIFLEVDDGPAFVDNNVIALNHKDGFYSHDASNVTVAHNLMLRNGHFGVWSHVATDRPVRGKLPEASGMRIVNNLMIGNAQGAISLPLKSERARNNLSDANAVTRGSGWPLPVDPIFYVNNNSGRIRSKEIAAAFGQALDAKNIPAAERPNLELWRKFSQLGLDHWRLLTGNDSSSIVPSIDEIVLSPFTLELRIAFKDDGLRKMSCSPIPGITRDYFGKPFSGHLLPGPFQELRLSTETQTLILWPNQRGGNLPSAGIVH